MKFRNLRSYTLKTVIDGASIVCVAAILLIIQACSNDQPRVPAVTQSSPILETSIPTPVPSESSLHQMGGNPFGEIRLEYVDPQGSLGDYPVELNPIEATRVAKSSIIVKRIIDSEELGNYFIYVKKADDTQLYAGMEIVTSDPGSSPSTSDVYEIGIVGELPYLNDIAITKSNLFGRSYLLVYGVCGANCVTNNWIHFTEAVPGVPISAFRLNTHVQEVDLDEDGTLEVVATESSTIGKVQIYKKVDDQIKFVDLNIALQAEHPNSVVYDGNQHKFTAIFSNLNRSYTYKKGEDVMIEDEIVPVAGKL